MKAKPKRVEFPELVDSFEHNGRRCQIVKLGQDSYRATVDGGSAMYGKTPGELRNRARELMGLAATTA